MIDWLAGNWLKIVIPVLALLATFVVGLWLRTVLNNAYERSLARTNGRGTSVLWISVRRQFLLWFLLQGAAIAIEVSSLSTDTKALIIRAAESLFILSLGWMLTGLSDRLLRNYLPRMKSSRRTVILATNLLRIIIIVFGALIVLDIWGISSTPLLLIIAVIMLGTALALRNAAPDLFAGFQLGTTQHIKVGDYIKLETGEEGYVTEISWNNTRIKALDESIFVVPNSRFLRRTVVNYGHPLKKAKEPFHFKSRTHLTELTGLKARNLHELADTLKKVPDAVIYHHTHSFLEQHQYLTPEPSNDFAVWVSDKLGDVVLGERLASVDTFEFPNLGALRERLVGIVEESLAAATNMRLAMPGEEFYFMKSVSVILPSPYVACDLREFVETLRKISLGSLYFHIFESRLRLGKGLNDFSLWMQNSLDEPELAEEIGRLDPYTYTLEGLRLVLIQLIEKRIQ